MLFKKNREEILEEMMKDASENIPQITNYSIGGVFRLFLEMAASFLKRLYDMLDSLQPNRFLQTASGQYLDWKAEELGLSRRPAVKARGYILFHKEDISSNVRIPAGKVLASRPNMQGRILRYTVCENSTLNEGFWEGAILVEAEQTGSDYNAPNITELVTPIREIVKVSCPKDWLTCPGTEEEDDNSLRLRCQALWRGIGGANADAYISWAKGVAGIDNVKVVPTARGAGTVDVICTAQGNTQPNEDLLQKVRDIMEDKKPIGTDCQVSAPLQVFINLNVDAVFLPEYSPSKQAIGEAASLYFSRMAIGTDFEPSILTGVLASVEGVKSIRLNNTERRSISDLQIARLGLLTVDVSSADGA